MIPMGPTLGLDTLRKCLSKNTNSIVMLQTNLIHA